MNISSKHDKGILHYKVAWDSNSIQKKSMLEFNYRNKSTKSDALILLISEHIDCNLLNFPKDVTNRLSKPKI